MALFAFLSIPAAAEYNTLYQKQGLVSSDQLGRSVAGAGDVNGDGVVDFIVGAAGANPNGVNHAGSAYVYSGADGTLLYQKDGFGRSDEFGWAVAGTGDVNGDGRDDFIIGARFADPETLTNAGKAYVYSGMDGSLLYEKNGLGKNDEMGFSVAGAGDVNGDGKSDFIAGARLARPGGRPEAGSAFVFSGADGTLLYQMDGSPFAWLGYSAAGAGDVNADGRDDFIIGAPLASPDGKAKAGSVYLYSGLDGGLLHQVDGPQAGDVLGLSVAAAAGAIVAGAPFADRDGKTDAGSVFLFSEADGSLLFEKKGQVSFDYLGWAVAAAGDVNADGQPDFMGGAPFSNPNGVYDAGIAFVFSGADGSLLFQKTGTRSDGEAGWSLAGVGDESGDSRNDFIIGSPGGNSASVYAACTADKGDLNASGGLTPSDLVLALLCLFPGRGSCDLCFADLDCDGLLTIADVVSELNAVFLGAPPPC